MPMMHTMMKNKSVNLKHEAFLISNVIVSTENANACLPPNSPVEFAC